MLAMEANDNAGHQVSSVIVDDHREHARSYRGRGRTGGRRCFRPSGLPLPAVSRYTRRLSKVRQRVLPVMEINPILNTIKDLSERSETIRGYL
ncbi:hypothetical protein [Pseudomonas sp. R37(2017)]|uniref:hypothetical protein n=1 Tax=Pseudomonas sp. R37(2017) TaxID=1981685 RepID=UPI0015B22AD2|nr:hypothetical protein [Pseudomonas sp. R37(2017)]